MQAIEVFYRLVGAKEADKWIPVPFKNGMSPRVFRILDGIEFCLENYTIDTSYSDQIDVDRFIEHEGEMEVLISCGVEPNCNNELVFSTIGTSDNFEGEIEVYKIPFNASPKEFWMTIKDALESAEEYLMDWEVDHRMDEDEMGW